MRYITLLTASLLLFSIFGVYAKGEPIAGKDYIWIDLGKKNEGVLLTQSEQGDGVTEPDTKAGVDCRKQPYPYNGPGHNHIYFKIDDSFMFSGNFKVWIVMEYFDVGEQIDCQYDSNGAGPVNGAFRGAGNGAFPVLRPTNTEKWLIHIWPIKDGKFENRANGSDFRFSTHASGDMWINRVWVTLFEPPNPFNPDNLGRPKAVHPGSKLAIAWGMVRR